MKKTNEKKKEELKDFLIALIITLLLTVITYVLGFWDLDLNISTAGKYFFIGAIHIFGIFILLNS